MSLYNMHENARRSDRRRNSGKTRRVARTNAKVRKMVRRRDRKMSLAEAIELVEAAKVTLSDLARGMRGSLKPEAEEAFDFVLETARRSL